LSIGAGGSIGPRRLETVELLERLLEILRDRTFCVVYDDVEIAITYDIGDGDDARRILEAMDDHASEQGFDDAATMVAHYRGEN
jgi:hypothetical protein